MRYLTGVVILIAASIGCSRGADRTVAASPTTPTAALSGDARINFIGGVSGPMDVLFPSRGDSFQFRTELEAKYQTGLNRPASTTYVDVEGEVVWTQEYIRYRVNGCDHATAVSRVMTQIDGGVAGGICSAPAEGLVLFPSRADSLQFRRELETKYQQMGRGLSTTFVDMEGGVIWTQEYLRYRANSCDHATASAKVFSQIDGGPVPDTCFVACSYVLNPGGVDIGSSSASSSFEIRPNPVACAWTAESDASWLTISSDYRSGSTFTVVPYSVTGNNGTSRTGHVTVTWQTGSARFTVFQAGTPYVAGFTLVDPYRSSGTTTECHFRSSSTPCNFTAFANLPGTSYTYTWNATYLSGTQKTFTQTGASSTFSFSDSCGGTAATAEGADADLDVTLTITDSQGNTVTIRSGENSPALRVKRFTC